MANARAISPRLVVALFVVLLPVICFAQYAEQNVNMVAGTDWPNGDPFLQRQNEPSVAISTRNPLHLLAGANDYRTVDLPFDTPASPDNEERGDAWLGVFKSRNGGQSWWSNLLDGYPQQANSTSPLHGYQAGADAVVRSAPNGMFYLSGIVLNRDANPLGGVFVARFIDNNNTENGDPFGYLGAVMVDKGSSGAFLDKPWVAVGPGAGTCSVTQTLAGQSVTQSFPAQNVYLAYTTFVGGDNNIRTKLMFARSTNCGQTWSASQKLSEGYPINQGAQIVVSPTGPIYVVWRRFKTNTDPDAIMVAKSVDQGQTFTKAAVVRTINPFEQGMTYYSIRTNAYPAATVDASGRLYVVWSDRGFNAAGDGRIVLMHSADGVSWTGPTVVDPAYQRGHQFMPTMTNVAGKIVVAYYDLRDDSTVGIFTNPAPKVGNYLETREPVGDLPLHPEFVFTQYLLDQTQHRRHTLDIRAARASVSAVGPSAFDFVRVSRYVFGSRPNSSLIEQLQFNVPNLPLFRLGSAPFIGDYIDITGYSPKNSGVYHVVWTDNRDVRPPKDGNWANYTPPASAATGPTSKFTGGTSVQCISGQSGMRNQNIYSSRLTDGLFAGSPGNAKQLAPIQRTFAVFVQNARAVATSYRLTIVPPPAGTQASFDQFDASMASIDVPVQPHSTATRTVYISSNNPKATVTVDIAELDGATPPAPVPGGLTTSVPINPDVTNPDVTNPDVTNPDVTNPDVTNPDVTNPDVTNTEVHNPDVTNPDVTNPDVTNPDVTNPDVTNPDVTNPDVTNPDVTNPDVTNPDVTNPDVTNPDVTNSSVTDTTWTTHNKGNTTSGYEVKLVTNTPIPNGVRTQLIVHKTQQTPIANTDGGYSGCNLTVQKHSQVLANIIDPHFTDAGLLTTPDPADATVWLAPGDAARITLRVYGTGGATFDAAQAVAPVVVAQANNNIEGTIDPTPSFSAPLFITTAAVKDAVRTRTWTMQFDAIGGTPPYSWASQPEGINNAGLFTYTFTTTDASEVITVTVNDAEGRQFSKNYTVRVFDPLVIFTRSLPTAITGQPYAAAVNAQGGLTPYTFSNYKVSFPAWLSIDSATGQLSGTPPQAGTSSPSVQVVDSENPPQSAIGQWTIDVADPLAITTTSLANGTVGTPYAQTLSSTGGLAPITWSLGNGSVLPDGLQLDPSGQITGNPLTSGTTNVTLVATDGSSPAQVQQATFSILIASNNIQFGPQPSNIVTGQNVTGGVRVIDNQGAPLPGVNVTISMGKNPGGTIMDPITITTNASGVGAFSLPNFLVGSGYTLIATVVVGNQTFQAESQPFNVDPSFLVQWAQQPVNTPVGQSVRGGVRVIDFTGAPIPGATVTVTLGQNPGNSSIAPINTVTNVDGLAAVVVNGLNVGSGYTLIATVRAIGFGTIASESQPFDVTP